MKDVLINAVVVVVALVRKDMSMTLCLLAVASKKRELQGKKHVRPGKHSFPHAKDRRDFARMFPDFHKILNGQNLVRLHKN